MINANVSEIKQCRLCQSKNLKKLFNLKSTPPANSYVNKKDLKKKIINYQLKINFCLNCGHLQLGHLVNREKIFKNYLYTTNTGQQNVEHFKKYANKIQKLFPKKNKKYKILDIASNDGTFLSFFNNNNFLRIGVDPARNLKKIAEKNKIIQIPIFFSLKTSHDIKKKYGEFDIITANHVCAHLENPNDFFRGVKELLSNKGIFVFEVSYRLEVIKNKTFDTIYHEHVDFHSLKPIINFAKKFNLELFDFDLVEAQGGSIRFYIGHKYINNIKHKKINNQINEEENKYKLYNLSTYNKFFNAINNVKKKLKKLLNNYKKNKLIIAGYGAPAKATTFTYFFNLNKSIIKYIFDDNAMKQGKFTPGKRIPILSSKLLYKLMPDVIVILAWNYYKEIITKHKEYLKYNKKFIIPFPKIRIISK
jgi:SAM-dependent methyltransferase